MMLCSSDAQFFLTPSNHFFKPLKDSLICHLGLTIYSRMSYWWKLMPYTHIPRKISKRVAVKLLFIIRYECAGYPKLADDIAPHKIYYFLSCDGGNGLCLRPLEKIFHGYHHELLLPHSLWEWTQYIYSPLWEWPETWYTRLWYSRHVDCISWQRSHFFINSPASFFTVGQ